MVKVRTRGQGTHNVHFKSSQLMNTRLFVCVCVCFSPHLSTLERREQRLELSSSGTMSILWRRKQKQKYF